MFAGCLRRARWCGAIRRVLKDMKLRTRIIGPIIAAMVLLSLAVLFGLREMEKSIVDDTLGRETANSRLLISETTAGVTKNLEALIYSVTTNREFIQAMRARDRDRLFELGRPSLDKWQALSGVTHFYFHAPDGVNVLRVHMKDKFGDTVKRKSFRRAAETGRLGVATEIGLTGEWVRRVVVPWHVDGQLLGYVELGVDMEHIYASARRDIGATTLILLDKKQIQFPDIWESRRKKLDFSPYPWETLPDSVVAVHSGIKLEPAQLRALRLGVKSEGKLSVGDREFVVQMRPLYDELHDFRQSSAKKDQVAGDLVGMEVQILDVSNIQAVVSDGIRGVIGMLVVLLLAMIAGMFGFLGRIQLRMDTEEARIQQQLDEKTSKLREYQSGLEEMVQQRTADLNRAQAVAHVGSWSWDLVGNRMEWSDECYRIFGVKPGSPASREVISARIYPDDLGRVVAAWQAACAGADYGAEYCILVNDEMRWVSERAEFVRAENGQAVKAIGTVQDITEHKQAEVVLHEAKEMAEASSRAKNDFLSSMSHELRTPLNAVLGFAQLLRLDDEISANTRTHVEEIERAGEHLLTLVNDVIDLSRIEAGRIELSMEVVSVKSVLDKSLTMISPLARNQGIWIINSALLDERLAVKADASRLRQILINFLSNAIKYNRPQGSVTLHVQSRDERLRISVTDTGTGIALTKQNRIFNEAFDRLGKQNSAIEGTGIGLVITKRVCEAMGGRVGFDSVEGQGSTFWVELPMAAASEIPAEPEPDDDAGPRVAQPTSRQILLAEDNKVNQRLAVALLKKQGYQVEVVENGKQAVVAAASGSYALVLMDCQMPEMSGFEAAAAIRRAEAGSDRHLPIVAMTANAMEGDRERCLSSGMDDYLSKPINASQLQAMVRLWLG